MVRTARDGARVSKRQNWTQIHTLPGSWGGHEGWEASLHASACLKSQPFPGLRFLGGLRLLRAILHGSDVTGVLITLNLFLQG